MTPVAATAATSALPAVVALAGLLADRPEGALVWSLCAALAGVAVWVGGEHDRRDALSNRTADLALRILSPILFAAAVAFVAAATEVPRPWAAAGPAVAVLGVGILAARYRPAATRALLPFVAAAALVLGGLPDLFGSAPAVWARTDPALGALVLDLSPATWVGETGGLDWMRHPSVYAPAGTDWFSDVRRPIGATLGLAALALGFLAAFAARRPTTTRNDR